MAPQAFDTSLSANENAEATMQSLLAGNVAGAGMGVEECGFVGDYEFNMLMALVAVATVAFGCIVTGWFI